MRSGRIPCGCPPRASCCPLDRLQSGAIGAMFWCVGHSEFGQRFRMRCNRDRKGNPANCQGACTSCLGIPYPGQRKPVANLDKELFRHLRESVELLNADAAADEQLAGKLNSMHQPGKAALFPNVKVRNKDKAHASRRITSRTWSRDPYLKKVAWGFVISKIAITHRIQNSDVLRARWHKNLQMVGSHVGAASQIKTLAAARHRFDSYSLPFKRGVIFWHALVRTAYRMQDERKCSRRKGRLGVAPIAERRVLYHICNVGGFRSRGHWFDSHPGQGGF